MPPARRTPWLDQSPRRAQPCKGDGDEPANGGFGRHASGGREGMEAVAGKLVGRDIISQVAGRYALDEQVPDEIPELPLRPGDVFPSMQKGREFGAVVLVGHERERLEHSFDPLAGGTGPIPDFGEMFEVAGDLAFVPGDQYRVDVGKVLVQRRPPYSGVSGDLGHGDRGQPALGH